jgi:predicted nuclease with TOPRIM domain
MELDAINNKRPFSQKEKLPEVPELKKNNSLTGIINPALINQDEQKIDIENDNVKDLEDEDDEVFEEIEVPNEESGTKVVKTENANSAFDNTAATFYV